MTLEQLVEAGERACRDDGGGDGLREALTAASSALLAVLIETAAGFGLAGLVLLDLAVALAGFVAFRLQGAGVAAVVSGQLTGCAKLA